MRNFRALFKRKGGTLVVRSLHFVEYRPDDEEDEVLEFSLRDCKFKIGGENNTFIHLILKNDPSTIITVSDLSFASYLKEGNFKLQNDLAENLKRAKIKKWMIRLSPFFLFAGVSIVFTLAISYSSSNFIGKLLSFENCKPLGRMILEDYLSGGRIDSSKNLVKDLEGKLLLLQQQNIELQNIPFEIHVMNLREEENAFALPGAIIVFTEKLLKNAKTEEEIFGILAHEMAHVKERHNLRSLAQGAGLGSSILVLSFFMDSFSRYALSFIDLVGLKYSRVMETQADKGAVEILNNAGISTSGLISFFNRISAKENQLLEVFQTHPTPQDRIRNLEKLTNTIIE